MKRKINLYPVFLREKSANSARKVLILPECGITNGKNV